MYMFQIMELHGLNYSRLLLFYATLILVLVYGSKACLEEERAALLNYKAFLKPRRKSVETSLSSWVSDPKSDCCEWERVTCDPASGRVIKLSLRFLYGATPHAHQLPTDFLVLNFSVFTPFKQLRDLDLSLNCFNHSVFTPSDKGGTSAMSRLETLDLSNCAFGLSIMTTLSHFTSLKTLLLPNNNMTGPFPVQELLALHNLEHLDLSGNDLERPTALQDFKRMSGLRKLETLNLSRNSNLQMSATYIFKSLSSLKFLKNLVLSSIDIYGVALSVHDLSLLQNLEMLDLSYNYLTITSQSTTTDFRTLSRLKRLQTLDLSRTGIDNRTVIQFVSHLPALRSLFISDNGRMILDDEVIANLSNLEVLVLRNAARIVPIQGLCKLKNLQVLDISSTNITQDLSAFSCLRNFTSLRALDLSDNYLSGNISSFVAQQKSLEYLSLSYNNFEGTFPLSSLSNNSKLKVLILGGMRTKNFQVETENPPSWVPSFQLEYLDMSDCQVNSATGTIPTFLSYQRELRFIDLSNTNLVGRFPNWLILNNTKLEGVFLNNNSLDGSFVLPSGHEGQHMDHLYILDVSHNKIQGKLPETLGFFSPNLELLNASFNAFDGNIPASIREMSGLKTLDLSYNNFSGELTNDTFRGCISLLALKLSHNSLGGQILHHPPESMKSLEVLMVDNNHFNGTLQQGLSSLKSLHILDVSNNEFSGELPWWLGNLELEILSVSGNNMEGTIPSELCKPEVLSILNLSHNRFSGTIPSCLYMPWLTFLHLQNNSLTGTIPESIFRSSGLISLDLGDNNLTGGFPKILEVPIDLMFLSLAGNQLHGQLPRHICNLTSLNLLDLSRNNFSGSIPSCFNDISFGNNGDVDYITYYIARFEYQYLYSGISIDYQYPNFEFNMFDKAVARFYEEEVQITTKGSSLLYKGSILNSMSALDLSCNQLAGKIPWRIGDLGSLHALNLSHNYLNGSIPESFQKLESMESLDLSFNKLSGPIPLQLQDLSSLSVFNVSYNNLSGKAPDKGQFGTFDESSYIGNPYLSFNVSNRGNAVQPPPPPPAIATLNDGRNNSAIDFTSFWWAFAATFLTVFSMFIAVLWINPHWRRLWFHFIEDCLYKCFGGVLKDAFY